MTVCTAAIFRWIYDDEGKDVGPAVITAADKMLTDEGLGIEYEREYSKSGFLTDHVQVLVASSIPIHSQILKDYIRERPTLPEKDVQKLAYDYARRMREYRAERAAEISLAPLKLDHESFLARQREMDPNLVMELANEMRAYRLDAEALVVGCDDKTAHLYHISNQGIVTCHDDIGFVSAGIGGIHSSAQFMRLEYINTQLFYPALYQTYLAKKRAEAAPGCGPKTDMRVINRLGNFPIDKEIVAELDAIYQEREQAVRDSVDTTSKRLIDFEKRMRERRAAEKSKTDP